MTDEELIGISVNPKQLWKCGASYFPQIAVEFSKSAALLDSGSASDVAYTRTTTSHPATGPSVNSGPVPHFVNMVIDELRNMMRTSTQNLFATGDALEKVAWAYVNTDEGNGIDLKQYVEDELKGNENGDKTIWTDEERNKLVPTKPEED